MAVTGVEGFQHGTTSEDLPGTVSSKTINLDARINQFECALVVHIFCTGTIVVTGLVGNALTIYIHTRSTKNYPGNVYITALATLDLFAILFLAPQMLFVKDYATAKLLGDPFWMDRFFDLLLFIMITYLGILDTMALDRTVAVFSPFSYSPTRCRALAITASIAICSLLVTVVLRYFHDAASGGFNHRVTVVLFVLVAFTILIVCYPAIACRLYKQKRKVGAKGNTTKFERTNKSGKMQGPGRLKQSSTIPVILASSSRNFIQRSIETEAENKSTANTTHAQKANTTHAPEANTTHAQKANTKHAKKTNSTHAQKKSTTQVQKKSNTHSQKAREARQAVHVTTAKMFALVTVLYVVSFSPFLLMVLSVSDNFNITYMYFVNHIGNPVIYFIMNDRFRKDCKEIWQKMKCR